MLQPLMNLQKLEDRLDSIEDLMSYSHEASVTSGGLRNIPDMERIITKVFTYSIKSSVKAIYFENVSFNKLREMKCLLKAFSQFK